MDLPAVEELLAGKQEEPGCRPPEHAFPN